MRFFDQLVGYGQILKNKKATDYQWLFCVYLASD